MELGCGSFVEVEWALLFFITCYREFFFYLRIVCPGHQHIFFFLCPTLLPQPGLGRIAEQVQVLVA